MTAVAISGLPAVSRARKALARLVAATGSDQDCLLPAALLAVGDGDSRRMAPGLLARYGLRAPAYGRENPRRYRWGLGFRAEVGHPTYAATAARVGWWRPREADFLAERPGWYAKRLVLPAALATQFEFWGRIADDPAHPSHAAAKALLDEAQQVAEADLAAWILAADPWADTFALWLLTGYPHPAARLRDLIFALAVRYAQLAIRDGAVRGIRYPFFGEPLPSASAHLARSLWRLGIYPTLLPRLLELVRFAQQPDGGWADPGQPSDVLTTLAAGDVLATLDPRFDPAPAIDFMVQRQEAGGWWRALNPEVPWLTAAVADWIERCGQPFTDRFAWPELPVWSRDRTTGLPTMAVFDELAIALAGMPGLAQAPLEAAFIDLAGFGEFNNRRGMDAGDAALAAYAAALRAVPRTMVIRQGGDELLVLGPPGVTGVLEPQLRGFLGDWQDAAERVGIPRGEVVPRILLACGAAGEIRELRGALGTAIGVMKKAAADPGPMGVMLWL
ncbi:MAG TPA: diguanylate cyclase [Candidatus Limnocylindria bacterium]